MTDGDWSESALVTLELIGNNVAVLTLADPARRNALSTAMGRALSRRMAELDRERDIRAIILTGAGGNFSSGGDLDLLGRLADAGRDPAFDAGHEMRAFYDLFLRVRTARVPVIAAVEGFAVGAGACLALACDLMVAAEDACIAFTFAALGLHPGMGATWLLPRAAGSQRAALALLTGRRITGAEALEYGIAAVAAPRDGVLDSAVSLASEIVAADTDTVRAIRSSLAAAASGDLDSALDREAAAQARSFRSGVLRHRLAVARSSRVRGKPSAGDHSPRNFGGRRSRNA